MRELASGITPEQAVPAATRVYWQWRLAAAGDAVYESMLADSYDLGRGVPADFAAAVYWLRRAADQGNAQAQGSLAWHLYTGVGGQRDAREAYEWANRAAATNADAMALIGEASLYGRGVAKNGAVALDWFQKAAAAGSANAASALANLYQTGTVVARDDAHAAQWYRKAAALGSDKAAIAIALTAATRAGRAVQNARTGYWLALPDNPATAAGNSTETAFAPTGRNDGRAAWDALSALDEALGGEPFAQFQTGILFWRGDGLIQDRALGDAWLRRAQAAFAAQSGWQTYAEATRVVETRMRESLTGEEKDRADLLAQHLLVTVHDPAYQAGPPHP
jgi:TPR repeat protein